MMEVWTEGYFPLSLGGSPHRPMIVQIDEAELGEKHDLGKGYFGYVLKHPDRDKEYVVESQTGVIIGNSLEAVRKDIEEADEEVMRKQIEAAKERVNHGTVVEADHFWRRMR